MTEGRHPLTTGTLYRRRVAMAALEVMAQSYNVPLAQLTMAGRQRASVAFARQMAMYLCHVVGGLSMREVSVEFGRERSTVSHACHAIEDRRDGEKFETQAQAMEAAMRAQIARIHRDLVAAAKRRRRGEGKSFDGPGFKERGRAFLHFLTD